VRRAAWSRAGALFALASTSISGCSAPVVSPARATTPNAVAPRTPLAALDAALAVALAAGATDARSLDDTLGGEGDRAGAFVELPPSRCVLAFARGSETIADVDLFVFREDGAILGADESSSAEAGVLACPGSTDPGRVFVSARIASGVGRVAVGVALVEPERALATARATRARAPDDETGRLESWPGLEAKIVRHRAGLGGGWEDVRRFAVSLDPRAPLRLGARVEPGRCVDVLVTPSDELATVELVAESEDGRVVARGRAEGRDRALVLCSERGHAPSLVVRPRGGGGAAAVIVARSRPGVRAELEASVPIDPLEPLRPLADERTRRAREVHPAWGAARLVATAEARSGRRTSVDVPLGPGCTRLDVVAGAPLGPVSAAIWDVDARRLAETDGPRVAPLLACVSASSTVRLDVESRALPGPFAVELRAGATLPPALGSAPRAAARLFDRVVAPYERAPASLASAALVALEAGRRFDTSAIVAPNTCAELVVALDEGRGVEVRRIDDATGEDAIGRGAYVASERLCAGASPRRARFEITSAAASSRALVVTHVEPSPP
jgi:hypothetical protein